MCAGLTLGLMLSATVVGATSGTDKTDKQSRADFQLAILNWKSEALVDGKIDLKDILDLSQILKPYLDSKGRVTPEIQLQIFDIEKSLYGEFDSSVKNKFQTLVAEMGAQTSVEILKPEIDVPLWLKEKGPLDQYKSAEQLPQEVDYIVIGAGLTGASAALHLAHEAQLGKKVAVLERGDKPAFGASGRNGGNIEMIKENYLNDYRGFVEVQKDILKHRFPGVSNQDLELQSKRQATYLLKFFQNNVKEIMKNVKENHIQADISMKGWLRIAENKEEEKGLAEEIAFAKNLGLEFSIWSPEKIKKETGISTVFYGRYIKQSGNYHPFKYTNETLMTAMKKGVQLYTETNVDRVERQSDGRYMVYTSRGAVLARKLVVATNAQTSQLFPELSVIEPRVSHIVNFKHTANEFNGMTVTMKKGDWYGNFPKQEQYKNENGEKRGTLHVGGGYDTPIPKEQVDSPPFYEEIYKQLVSDTNKAVADTNQRAPERAWSGVMAFTEDRSPILSFLYNKSAHVDKAVVFAVAFNGYGGSQSAMAGRVAAEMAMTGEVSSDIPEDLFSMKRFMVKEPLFKVQHWRCNAAYSK